MKTTLLIAMIVMLSTVAQARNPIPQPTQAQVEWSKMVQADANSNDADKAKAKIILERISGSIEKVCNIAIDEDHDINDCAAKGDFPWNERSQCVDKVLSGAEAVQAKQAIKHILEARKLTEKAAFGVAKLPKQANSIHECLMGEFTASDRKNCCASLGLGSVMCGKASEIDEVSRDNNHGPICQ